MIEGRLAMSKSILERYPEYELTIGMEVHVQLNTASKIFCSCPNKFGDKPNTNICPICAGYPGTLPVLNKKVVDYGIMTGLATNSTINRLNYFSRKHYTYPDLPKNYQITQDENPICLDGHVMIKDAAGNDKKVRLVRIHIEEDAGKNTHGSNGESFVDLNRTGTPLLEIVSHPDLTSAQETRDSLNKLHAIVVYLGVSDGNMEEGSFRADTNISVRKKGAPAYGTRVELKNINSFKFIAQAIEFEAERQITMLESGERITQETRLWDSKKNQTYFMRSKEEAQDYRFFTDPDLPAVYIDDAWLEAIKKTLPELPDAKIARFQEQYGVSAYDAGVLIEEQVVANFFEQAAKLCGNAKLTLNWVSRDVLGYLKEKKLSITSSKITPALLAELICAIDKGVINNKVAQDIFLEMAESGKSPQQIIQDQGLQQIDSVEEIEAVIKNVIAANPDNVAKLQAGNERLFGFFVGQVMKETKGKGNPQLINDLLRKYLVI